MRADGRLTIKGINVESGYLAGDDSKAFGIPTAAPTAGGGSGRAAPPLAPGTHQYVSGDCGYWNASGFLCIEGRVDSVVKVMKMAISRDLHLSSD